ncbi:MAG: hypothetical protein ACI4JC_08665 [Faecalibacterium sp.]
MARKEVRFRTQLLGYRKTEVNNCVEHLNALNAMDQRLAKEIQQGLEDKMAQLVQENSALRKNLARQNAAQSAACATAEEAQSQLEALTRKLAAAQSEIRRYQTRLFACERELLALRRENAELEARCERSQREGFVVAPSQQLPVLDTLPVRTVAERVSPPASVSKPVSKSSSAPKKESWQPVTELERLSVFLMEQMDRLMKE